MESMNIFVWILGVKYGRERFIPPIQAIAGLKLASSLGTLAALVLAAVVPVWAMNGTTLLLMCTMMSVALLVLPRYCEEPPSLSFNGRSHAGEPEAVAAACAAAAEGVEGSTAPPQGQGDALAAIARCYQLTNRETEVLGYVARGRSAAYIRDELHISLNTANAHIKHIYQKTDVHSKQELIDLVESFAG